MRMFNYKSSPEIKSLIQTCPDFKVLCSLNECDLPAIDFVGHDLSGHLHVFKTTIAVEWIEQASCSGQFVARLVEEIRKLVRNKDANKKRSILKMLSHVFIQGSLLPFLDSD